MARAASHYPLITEFTTLSRHRVMVGARTLAYRNTTWLLGQPGWNIWITKTGFTREAGHCIAMEVNTQYGPVIIVLLGAGTQRARAADLMAIRRWLAVQTRLQASRAGQRIDEHQVGALSNKVGLRRASATASATRAQPQRRQLFSMSEPFRCGSQGPP
ncbi:hypothetical protein BJN34_09525 [Cupriavidus necator]|uniref:Peptidase S11 D-alanyl-D-alanine carboxypeptidase A N-terminal domain-containing protein n=1 Tax=Cupriavidus necator TaxID=106590 RepID=A0A1U9UNA9_CUPNE|nr:hypothetical protein [Cupriavidus necator]AQV94128.1 hypothetical protein BJN34_09525 [Cupriavidus necator]